MSDTRIYIDSTDFDRRFKELVEQSAPGAIDAGFFKAGNELLRDSEEESPKTPFKTGDLRAARQSDPIQAGSKQGVEVGYNKVQATRLHEGEPDWNWTQERAGGGVGPKFMETKMVRHGRKYMDIVALYLRKLLGG